MTYSNKCYSVTSKGHHNERDKEISFRTMKTSI